MASRANAAFDTESRAQTRAAIDAQVAAMRQVFPRGLGQPALQALAVANLTTFARVATRSEAQLLTLHGMGPKGVRILRDALKLRGLNFAD